MPKDERPKYFDISDMERDRSCYRDEARSRYGETALECERRTDAYTPSDWETIMRRWNEIFSRMACLIGCEPSDSRVQQLVADIREHINTYFYDCTIEIFRGLADLYVDDPRFSANIDRHGDGLSAFLRQAMIYYCEQELAGM